MEKRLIVIGTSLGGLEATKVILSEIPYSFNIPIALVIHREEYSPSDLLIDILNKDGQIKVVEAEDKMKIENSKCFIAPAGYHLLVDGNHFALSQEEKVNHSRPSIDVLLESAADTYRSNLIAVVLTGNSVDGAKGLKAVKAKGGITIAQDPHEAKAKIMPKAAICTANPDYVIPLIEIRSLLLKLDEDYQDK
jgi:two-component system chemotaxis response regulator CheB